MNENKNVATKNPFEPTARAKTTKYSKNQKKISNKVTYQVLKDMYDGLVLENNNLKSTISDKNKLISENDDQWKIKLKNEKLDCDGKLDKMKSDLDLYRDSKFSTRDTWKALVLLSVMIVISFLAGKFS